MRLEFREIMTVLETDEQVKVVIFDSAVEGFFLNHSDLGQARGADQFAISDRLRTVLQ
jgi:enoyl-CoA hydratase/carnithine racemase